MKFPVLGAMLKGINSGSGTGVANTPTGAKFVADKAVKNG